MSVKSFVRFVSVFCVFALLFVFPCAAHDVGPCESCTQPTPSSTDPPLSKPEPEPEPEPGLRHHLIKVLAASSLIFQRSGLGIGYEYAFFDWVSVAINFGYGFTTGAEFEAFRVYGFDVMALMTTPGTHRFVLGLGVMQNYFPRGECTSSWGPSEDCTEKTSFAFDVSYRYNPPTSPMFFEIGFAEHSAMAIGLKLSTGFTF